MRMLLVELDRLRSRRAVALILLAAALLTALLAATAIWDTRPVSDADRADAELQATTAAADPAVQQDLEQCRANPDQYFGSQGTAADCERILVPRPEDFLNRNALDLAPMVEHRGVAVVMLTAALLVICGATFAGGDWSTGSVSNQLLFRPRRVPVWLAKAGAITLGALLTSVVLIGGFWLAMWLTAGSRGIDTPDPVLRAIVMMSLRGVALATAGALGGYALTMLLRSTVATIAVLFAYAVVGEAIVLALPLERASQWSLANNVLAWVNDGTRIFDSDILCTPGRGGCIQSYTLGLGHGATYLGVLLVLAVVLSVVTFRRRDVP